MALPTINIIHFHNGSGGGVLSVIRNLLLYKQHGNIKNHVIYTINKDQISDFVIPTLTGAASEQVFKYSAKWNLYYTCKNLAKLLPDDKAIIVAHDWLELGMASNLGLQNPVVQFVHGDYDYYYGLAKKNEAAIDNFICISPVIYKKLLRFLPLRKNTIHQRYFPIPEIPFTFSEEDNLNIFYAVRDLEDCNKNFALLPKINKILNDEGVKVHWTIVGRVDSNTAIFKQLSILKKYKHFSYLANEELIALLSSMNLFVLPSLNEGLPVTLVETMKAGLVPLVTNWNNATSQLLIDGENGFYLDSGNARDYAEKIKFFSENRKSLKTFSENASAKAKELFDPIENTKKIEAIFVSCSQNKNITKKSKKIYGSRLDQKWIPNQLVFILRSVFK